MFKDNFGILVLIALGCGFSQSCEVDVRYPYPLFSKQFGSKNITFRAKKSGIRLSIGESIKIYCGSGLNLEAPYYSSSYNVQQTAFITCNKDNRIEKLPDIYGETLTAYCKSTSGPQLYESQKKLPNCDGYMNYVIGEKTPFMGTTTKFALCYDIESFTLKYANYIAYQKHDMWISHEGHSNELSADFGQKVDNLDNYFHFMRDQMQNLDETFFKDFQFDFDSILQDDLDETKKSDFAYIFNIMWWRTLRQNNWRFFLDALKKRTKSEKYLVYIGSYGNATMPARKGATDLLVDLSVRSSNLVVTAPTYIWSYVKSLTTDNEEEFVVIAHNSPYVVAPDHSEFCTNDICDEIAWLKESQFGHLRRIPTFGYTFCCRAEDVAKVINYFPYAKEKMETTTGAATDIQTSKNIEDDNPV
ncbi:uncharacterized protein [Eurosta solidaginis]|uniref:uncharacterized protein isoform X2 n=1 Tax=Eurosta solidaginis TaxID=178769 RepID=UPI003530C5C7